jgi:SAM-dependent methyltransferase
MEGYGPTTYGQRIAEIYDDLKSSVLPGQVELLHELAGNGPVLELGVGTGRIALPLASRGVEVHGIDSSEAMVAKLRAKPGAEGIAVTLGDFRDFDLAERFSFVFVAVNTFFALPDQGPSSPASSPCLVTFCPVAASWLKPLSRTSATSTAASGRVP